uniref:Peptidase S1 domain-containing protein n=2 Tax=Tetranychus urticae TaxID=32264 RepID=T1K8T7_TETUR
MMVLYSNIVSSTDMEDPEDHHEKIAYGFPVRELDLYPYFVSIQKEDRTKPSGYAHHCGGSLITRKIVLTAAHCLHDPMLVPTYRILPNYRNSPFIQDGDLTFLISQYVMHPNYNATRIYIANDIAVILMDQPDPRHGATIRLPTFQIMAYCEPVTIIGFGLTEDGVFPNELRSAVVYRLTDEICLGLNFDGSYIQGSNLCTANVIKSGICTADSGGPLIRTVNNISYVQGVAISSYHPCGSDYISNFVNVFEYLAFINHAILLLNRDELRSNQSSTFDGLKLIKVRPME